MSPRPGAVRRSLALPAAATAVALLAGGCGSGSNTSTHAAAAAASSGGAASSTSAGGPASGTINWEWPLPTSWDPVASSAGFDVHALGLVYASLTALDPAGNAIPGLATSWTYGSDGRSVTFTLRPNLTFSDGTPLDASAVKANIERGQTQANSNIASELSVISKVVVNSPTSFTLDLTQADYQVPLLLSGKDGMIVSPAAFANPTALATQPVGAGPFRLTSYVPDSHANLVRNPGYWDSSDIHVQNFTIQAVSQPQQILAALESGQVNVAYIQGNQVAAAKAAGFRIDAIPSEVVNEIDVQTTSSPLDKPEVVQAINYAIDRNALVQVQAAGYGRPAYQPFPPGFVGYNPALADLYPYDPAKAKQLLAEAGHPHGLTITLSAVSSSNALAEQIQSQLATVGIRANISNVPSDTETKLLYLDKSLAFTIDGTAGRNSPVEMLDVLYSQKGLMNVDGKTATAPAAVSQALSQALTVPLTSPQYPSVLQGAVATAVRGEPIHIWLYTVPRIFAYSPKVSGIPADLVQQRWEGVKVAG